MSRNSGLAVNDLVVGLAGARRNAAAALVCDGRVVAAAEQERFTRLRAAGSGGGIPEGLPDAVLACAGVPEAQPERAFRYAVAEDDLVIPDEMSQTRLPHAYAHACAAFLVSPFNTATILVSDPGSDDEISVWCGAGSEVRPSGWAWRGPGISRMFRAATRAFGFAPGADEHKLESLARVGSAGSFDLDRTLSYRDRALLGEATFEAFVQSAVQGASAGSLLKRFRLARDVQEHFGRLLVAMLAEIKAEVGGDALCLGGGLFFNTYLNSVCANAGVFRSVFVPPNPGNPGLAIGAALAVSAQGGAPRHLDQGSVFLGPEYSDTEIKQLLDNCKLTYDYLSEDTLLGCAVDALAKGQLVGWFQSRMEWGPRALGNRSILASPLNPYVLDNLNVHLKHREAHRTYAVAIPEERAPDYLKVPLRAPFMELESELVDPERVRALLPFEASRLRYQTVGMELRLFRRLLAAFENRTGCAMLVNTSLNGFHEPIACSPRDAVRLFFGTGLDAMALGRFWLAK